MPITLPMTSNHEKAVSIGFVREDGDFQILATVNNLDDVIDSNHYHFLVQQIVAVYKLIGVQVIVKERKDTPDYVNLS